MKKRFLFLCLLGFILCYSNNVMAASVQNKEIDLYHLSEKYSNLKMPSNFKEENKIIVNGATGKVSYRVKEGENISVSADGVVKMEPTVWWCKGICYSWQPEDTTGFTKVVEYEDEDAVVEVRVGPEVLLVNVHTHLYEKYYAEKTMKDYLDNNIKPGMTEMEKMKVIMKFISMTRYSYKSSSYVDLVAGEGADCWGDTNAIMFMSDYVSIKAHGRNANKDPGAGSGHRNVAAILDGKLYVVDVMSEEKTPRTTVIEPTLNGFTLSYYTIIQYDGYDEIVYIPENSNINTMGNLAFYRGLHSESKVKEIHVPKTLTNIENGAFSAVSTLEKVVVDAGNPNYKNIGNNFYSKDGSILYTYPSGQKGAEFIVPKGVKTIDTNAFWGAESLKSVVLPSGLKKIGAQAFNNTSLSEVVIPASVTEIGDLAFDNVELTIKNRNAKLGSSLCNASKPIHGYKGSTTEAYAKENKCPFVEIPKEDYLKGDLNADGEIGLTDVLLLLKVYFNSTEVTDYYMMAGDINESGSIDLTDVLILLKEYFNQ